MYCYRRESSSSVTLAGLASGTGRAACARYVYRVVVLVPVRDEQTTAQRAAQGLFVPVHINEAWTWLCPHDPSIHPHRPDGATGWRVPVSVPAGGSVSVQRPRGAVQQEQGHPPSRQAS